MNETNNQKVDERQLNPNKIIGRNRISKLKQETV